MKAIQIKTPACAEQIVVLATNRTCKNGTFQACGSKRLAATRTVIAVSIQSFFEPAKKHLSSAYFFGAQSSRSNRVKAKNVLPADFIFDAVVLGAVVF